MHFGNRRYPWRRAAAVSIALLLGLLAVIIGARQAIAHDVKDPVCRMMVDSDTTTFRQELGPKTFYFCSMACMRRFLASPDRYVALADQLRQSKRRGYRVDFSAAHDSHTPLQLAMRFAIRYADNGALVRDFELVHERRMHLILVSDDLSWFEHQHPVLGSDGIFRLDWRFPHTGHYYLYADFTPADGDNQIQRVDLAIPVSRDISPRITPVSLTPDKDLQCRVGDCGVRLALLPDSPLTARHQSILTYTFSDQTGHPIQDMQPFVGVMGHLFAIRQDGRFAIHTHALHGVAPGSYDAAILPVMQAGHDQIVTPEMVSPTGPTFTFKLTVPAAGVYRIWAQFMRHNRVVTVPFTFHVLAPSTNTAP